ncbi:hypothetical protein GCM10010220_55280 [Streptomyces parvulus]|nr:hypothetical protein GCM10010220_55280 [Streptomyces parvulus]
MTTADAVPTRDTAPAADISRAVRKAMKRRIELLLSTGAHAGERLRRGERSTETDFNEVPQ